MKEFLTYTLVAAAAYGLLKYALFSLINYLTFHPLKYPEGNWDVSTFHRPVEDHWITTSDNVLLHSWYFPKQGTDTVLLWLHGNGSNISFRLEEAIELVDNLPVSLFALSYRGYGRSNGRPSEAGVYTDAIAAYDYVSKMSGVSNIVIYGKSLGGAVGIDLATKTKPAGLIVEAAFTSLAEMGKIMYPFLPNDLIAGKVFCSAAKLKKVTSPTLFIHGDKDELVPFEHGRELFNRALEPKTFYHVKNGAHDNLMEVGGQEYFRQIRVFLNSLFS